MRHDEVHLALLIMYAWDRSFLLSTNIFLSLVRTNNNSVMTFLFRPIRKILLKTKTHFQGYFSVIRKNRAIKALL